MTNRLGPWSRMIDAAIGSRASCEMLLAGGAADLVTGAPFVITDCDQVQPSFAQVGLDVDLVTDWSPPALGFSGTLVQFAGETTDNGCPVTDVTVQMNTLSGVLDASASTAPGGIPAINYFGLETVTVPVTTPPIGTTGKTHSLAWTSVFGRRPEIASSISAPAPAGSTDCLPGPAQVERTSETQVQNSFLNLIGFGTTATGDPASGMNGTCVLNGTEIEIVNEAGEVLDRHPTAAVAPVNISVLGFGFTLNRRATIATPVPGLVTAGPPASWNLSTNVNWSIDPGLPDVRWRLVYLVGQPAGIACVP
jgi:hypothetical protein